jgi:hypothetical protein
MNKKRILIAVFALLAISILVERTYFRQHRGFRVSKLISTLPPMDCPPPEGVDALLEQSFRYLGAGGTSFVFLGEDGKTVLKLFKHHQLFFKHSLWHVAFPGVADVWRIRKILYREKEHRHKRHFSFFPSCSLAFDELKEETGLIYLCQRPNRYFNRKITLYDTWGISHRFDLGKTAFALQKKATLLFPYLKERIGQGRTEEARQAIDAFIALIIHRCKKGIGDRDPNLGINFGFIDKNAVEFDLGSYYSNPSLNTPFKAAREVFFTTFALQKWLEKESPELLNYLLDKIAKIHAEPRP